MSQEKQTLFQKLIDNKKAGHNYDPKKIRYSFKIKIFIIVFTILISTLFFSIHTNLTSGFNADYSISAGYIWSNQPVIADFSFPIYKEQKKYNEEVKIASKNALKVFTLNENSFKEVEKKYRTILDLLNQNQKQNKTNTNTNQEKLLSAYYDLSLKEKKHDESVIKSDLKKYLYVVYQNGFINIQDDLIEQNEISISIHHSTVIRYCIDYFFSAIT